MEKIICDICGTTYPASTECCPICGCSNDSAAEFSAADIQYEDGTVNHAVNTRKKEIFDFDEVNADDYEDDEADEVDEEEYDEEEDEEEEPPRHNTFVVIVLTALIIVLLGAAAFIFVRFFLPNMKEEEPVATTAVVQETEMAEPSTEPTVPCQHMAMTNAGVAELNAEGQQFLLHIKALPENTTDKIVYTSGNESIATVTEDGKITAVSEGETVIYISCGIQRMECPVIVEFIEETVPPTTEATVPAETEAVAGTAENTAGAETAETTPKNEESATAAVGSANLKNVTLKLKKEDMKLGVYYSHQLELDCALSPEEVTWSSEHPHIATVDEQGNVTAVKEGTTSIIAKYGDQEVQCIVRCVWY